MAPKRQDMAAAVAEVAATGASAAEVAAKHGVNERTLRRRLAEVPKSSRRVPAPKPPKKKASKNAPPKSSDTVDDSEVRIYNSDVDAAFALDDRILAARNPAAGLELAEGRAKAAEGEAVLAEWLARPFPDDAFDGDTLSATKRLLGQIIGRFRRAGNSREASGLAEKALAAVGRLEQIEARRPAPPRPDMVLEALRRLDLDAIAKIEEHLPNPITPAEIS